MIPPREPGIPQASGPGGQIGANLVHFAGLLRRTGLPVGTDSVIVASRALDQLGLRSRTQVHAALRALMVQRHEHEELFDQAFDLFWRDPAAAQQAGIMALLEGRPPEQQPPAPGSRRLGEAMAAPRQQQEHERPPEQDATLTFSDREQLQSMDFEQMSAAQIDNARAAIRRLALPLDRRPTRRFRPDPSGPRIDLAATLRASLRRGGEIVALSRRRRVVRPPPLVVICDISGSMARYAQVLLHFLHAVANSRPRVHVFLFGTRLSNITRQLRHRDAEVAFQMVAAAVPDWSGGTRIGEVIAEFNTRWAKRVLGQGAVVLLMTDGLDRDGGAGLAEAMDRLHRSSRRLIWLNPLLRWSGFQPRSQGIRAMLPHVDEFRTIHNLDSLRALVELLSRPAPAARRWSVP
ncbi:MAG: vWA domain-containing protein [Janthinobacterium lividum]